MPTERCLIDSMMPLALEIRRMVGEGSRLPFRGEDLFNDRWLLRAVLDASRRNRSLTCNDYIASRRRADWFCGVTLETPFARRFEGDHLGEVPSEVGAIVASLANTPKAGEPIRLSPSTGVFAVFDSFLHGDPSEGPEGFPWYGRVARILACMARTAQSAGLGPGDVGAHLILVSPGRSIKADRAFDEMADRKLAIAMVSSRVNTYRDEDADSYNSRYEWLHGYFRPFAARTKILSTDWFTFLSGMYTGRAHKLYWFLLGCRYFGEMRGEGPARFFRECPEDTIAAMRALADSADQ